MLLDCPISRIVLLTYLASLQPFFTVCSISALAFEVLQSLLLLGIYTSLFIICAYILLQRRHNAHWIFPVLHARERRHRVHDVASIWKAFEGGFIKRI